MAQHRDCPDCEPVNRRRFVQTAAGAAAAASMFSLVPRFVHAAPTAKSSAETAVGRLYESLSGDQQNEVCLGWDDARRTKVNANWHITKANFGSFSKDQQAIIHEVLKGVTSEDGYERFLKQMAQDNGVEKYSIAIFGKPGSDKCCFTMTGRHLTIRADGNTTANAAFGGPIVYGHGAKGNSDRNLFWYQTKRANEVFTSLDADQRKKAMVSRAPTENAVQIREAGAALPGIAGSELSSDQKSLLKSVLADIMAPYRKEDVDEVMSMVEAGGGFDKVHIAYYQGGDIDDDGVWDVWRLEGPTMVCHFRGDPHVHAYINVAQKG